MEGIETFGTKHKVGVERRVVDLLGSELGEAAKLLQDNDDRDQFLIDSGYTPELPKRYWRLLLLSDVERPKDLWWTFLRWLVPIGREISGMDGFPKNGYSAMVDCR
jgi:hypothetical protein